MIHVDRSEVREPTGLKRLREAGLKHARKFFVDTPASERRQLRYVILRENEKTLNRQRNGGT